ncbi:hypothetical protein HPP92_008211 [Vanilla planifolia]|uniref:4-coumarate--CoA ligase n=1 Tax=Vanilla planifolia TaxID=51239 RepID=A0A835V7P5_VANPL|nr:hypothetical protein HPP92_008211 [Vanilla planifolia]
MEGSVLCSANYVPLSPLSFLLRAAAVYGDHASVIYGETRFTWRETRDRSLRLASVLSVLEVSRGDVVAVLAPNIPAMYELHFGVPMAGAILCTLNTRHNSSMLSILLRHSGAKSERVDRWCPATPEVLSLMERLGFHVIHSYGLTETYGPATVCTWHPEWDSLPLEDRARLKSRQGLQHHLLEEVDVKDPVTMKSVPADGKTMGEVMLRGNTVMCGYYRDVEETKKAFAGGWFRSGDLAVRQPDGYIKLKDRAKDIVISGGENVSTIEVESVLFDHPAVLEAAVVGRPDEHWGETPCAFVKLKEGSCASSKELIKFCRAKLPHYMAPKTVIFEDLPKTSTGKVQKFVLREKAKTLGSLYRRGGIQLGLVGGFGGVAIAVEDDDEVIMVEDDEVSRPNGLQECNGYRGCSHLQVYQRLCAWIRLGENSRN